MVSIHPNTSNGSREGERGALRIAMMGTRGVPAKYGGFETAVEEVGSRLVAMGHEVVVYCRGDDRSPDHLGMARVRLPALKQRVAETISHTALSVVHLLRHRTDVALVFNAANAPLLPIIRLGRIPVAVHVDGLEWKRAKWGPNGRRYYLANERLAVLLADELISDAVGIQNYYRNRYNAESVFLAYGAPILHRPDFSRLTDLGVKPGGYHLVVARTEPENHVDIIIDGYLQSAAEKPLLVVGSVPYPSEHERRVQALAKADPRVQLLGGVWDQGLLNALYAGSASYLHGHSVGGTNPSLLRAMGAGANVLAWDVGFNREVLGETGQFFGSPDDVAKLVEQTERDPMKAGQRGNEARDRAADRYRWDDVAKGYEKLCLDLIAGVRSRRSRRYAG
jgi:glycosyltransferase involved in cell wall biosynthesis